MRAASAEEARGRADVKQESRSLKTTSNLFAFGAVNVVDLPELSPNLGDERGQAAAA
jgi:hypothetical protein